MTTWRVAFWHKAGFLDVGFVVASSKAEAEAQFRLNNPHVISRVSSVTRAAQ